MTCPNWPVPCPACKEGRRLVEQAYEKWHEGRAAVDTARTEMLRDAAANLVHHLTERAPS